MDLWQGNCYVHVEFTARSIERIREEYPDAPVVAHPECTYAVRMLADEVCSTEKMVAFCQTIARARNHRGDGSGNAAPTAERDSRQDIHSRPDRQLLLRRMPVHENEHNGESVRRAFEYGAGNNFTRTLRKRAEAPILRMLKLSK